MEGSTVRVVERCGYLTFLAPREAFSEVILENVNKAWIVSLHLFYLARIISRYCDGTHERSTARHRAHLKPVRFESVPSVSTTAMDPPSRPQSFSIGASADLSDDFPEFRPTATAMTESAPELATRFRARMNNVLWYCVALVRSTHTNHQRYRQDDCLNFASEATSDIPRLEG